MSGGQLWTPARIKILRTMWGEGRTRTAIAQILGCSPTAVRAQISRLDLPPRTGAKLPKTISKSLRGGINSTMKTREEDETRVVKLATLIFQTHRLPGEGSLW